MTEKRSYSQTGFNALKARINPPRGRTKVQLPILNRLDRRNPAARGLIGWREGILSDLGGDDCVTTRRNARSSTWPCGRSCTSTTWTRG